MATKQYKGYTIKITTKEGDYVDRYVKLEPDYVSDLTNNDNNLRYAHRICITNKWDFAKMENLLHKYKNGHPILSINDLPSYLTGPRKNQKFMIQAEFRDRSTRIRFVNDDTKFCFFAATLVKLLSTEPWDDNASRKHWIRKVIITCFSMWQLALRLGYLNESEENLLHYDIWMEDAEKFLSNGYAVTGEIWSEMDTFAFVPILDPDYVYDEAAVEPETVLDRRLVNREKQKMLQRQRDRQQKH